jgi:F0F1-type ATP synthase epsilon subunit
VVLILIVIVMLPRLPCVRSSHAALEAKLKPSSYPAGAHIIQQGDVASAMYVIASGVAEVGNDDLTVMYGVKQEGKRASEASRQENATPAVGATLLGGPVS